ncbi:hypothetical protein [Ornithinibacillus californiensis]|uniref:hypothetical protein n=1 Tax=Ornithinibacillus californiensis TaxID=161536 RepID=UPI00064DDA67|nr:hypothetical protein [Ornithinibacillus californiensis]
MSWKSVEMQVALPRTQDAGKLQDQMQKSNQHFQEALAQSQLIQENQKRKKVQEFEEIHLQKEGQKENKSSNKDTNVPGVDTTKESIQHPYLGINFDSRS